MHDALDEVNPTKEAGHHLVLRVIVKTLRRVKLPHHTLAHQGNAVGEHHGLFLIVGDKNHGRAQLALNAQDQLAHFHTQAGIERT